MDFRIADDAVGDVHQRLDAAGGQVDRLQRPAALEQVRVRRHAAVGVQLAGVEQRVDGVVVAAVLVPRRRTGSAGR